MYPTVLLLRHGVVQAVYPREAARSKDALVQFATQALADPQVYRLALVRGLGEYIWSGDIVRTGWFTAS
jgi:hypothetical protein